jgi:hypothetical protein
VCLLLQSSGAHPIQRPVGGIIVRDAHGGFHTLGADHGDNGHGGNGNGHDGNGHDGNGAHSDGESLERVGAEDHDGGTEANGGGSSGYHQG